MKNLLVLGIALLAFVPVVARAEPPRLTMADFLDDSDIAFDDGDATDVLDAAMVTALASSRDGQRLALSTLLCEARQYREDVQDRLIIKDALPMRVEAMRTDARIARLKAKIGELGLETMECDSPAVAKLMECRGLVAPTECGAEDLATQVRAVERVAGIVLP